MDTKFFICPTTMRSIEYVGIYLFFCRIYDAFDILNEEHVLFSNILILSRLEELKLIESLSIDIKCVKI